jgi:gamma-glutamylcyclotransferase (GGCT)/AIG2-like uncharacterized protein YtfP
MISFPKWLNKQIEENYYTEDLPDLYKTETHYVFLADNLMQGKARHHKLHEVYDANYIGKAFTKKATYGIMMVRSRVEPVNPVFFEVVTNNEAAFIYGELYEVSPEAVIDLDYHQGNRLMSKRKKIDVVTRNNHQEVQAYTWLADPDYYTSPHVNDRLTGYTLREYLWNTPVIAWDSSIYA